ncbi:cytochrome c [Thiohalobacter sp. IOR34]|uniref:c-type cytochrome n=1 Tax=Thiohalobacter sp. IOR34 TaxID=3057176 RepID=UPI0025B05045|nr:cytochrome c [Thiohalobacter sp. IOR34]WJW75432.1 cytochrome c [Thiohalobacter sp. IOR34]
MRNRLSKSSLLLLGLLWLGPALAAMAVAEVDAQRQSELQHLLRHDCGSCHGMTLKGGLGPALLPQQLANKSDELLLNTILFGRAGTAMPPWGKLISEADARYLVQLLRQGGQR